jgi:curved DNA-binding protein CbpA
MLELIDYYLILQVDPAAEPEVVRAAYRALAAKYHPDRDGGSAERMVDINRAWDVLGNPEKRLTYDKSRVTLGPRVTTTEAQAKPEPDHDGGLQPRPWTTTRSGTVLDFGRYAGWSFPEIARHDPDFLQWLARMPIGRPYAAEIERTLAMYRPREQAPVAAAKAKGRFRR